jgi:hypothetical protein
MHDTKNITSNAHSNLRRWQRGGQCGQIKDRYTKTCMCNFILMQIVIIGGGNEVVNVAKAQTDILKYACVTST